MCATENNLSQDKLVHQITSTTLAKIYINRRLKKKYKDEAHYTSREYIYHHLRKTTSQFVLLKNDKNKTQISLNRDKTKI